ncbi:hypothetical protein GN958_ATG16071 [Phytophthora infestans]|uniref:Uncharacterized protein n=2 Tax=Phytophthora infestans TaxID=4787 RepID=A0A8S9U157_PHYIN|nr:hypothetical protein GN958_ATG16070 [Phytophthora infestans]KAF4134815.1 hypothetical protein GN958_ATG16071 [Phytophthora infestans]
MAYRTTSAHPEFGLARFIFGHWSKRESLDQSRYCGPTPEEGGLAVPNVKAEVLALAATEVTRWALTSNCTMLIAGIIRFSGTTGTGASETYVSLGFWTFGISGLPYPDSLWKAGRQMLHTTGDEEIVPPNRRTMRDMQQLLDRELPSNVTDWTDGMCLVSIAAFHGPTLRGLEEWCSSSRGTACLEWLPHTEVRALKLEDFNSKRVDISAVVPLLSTALTSVGDNIVCKLVTRTHIAFQARCGGEAVGRVSSARRH